MGKQTSYDRARYLSRREEFCAASRAYRLANYEEVVRKGKERQYRNKYGFGLDTKAGLFWLQGCKCASCGTSEPGSKFGWHTDHDHQLNMFRGILCQRCNVLVGHIESSQYPLALSYLGGTNVCS